MRVPESLESAPRRLDSLTGARFAAAFGVFLFHAGGVYPAVGVFGSILAAVGGQGSIGVDFFFVLSGFVLTWTWRSDDSAVAFYRRRIARLAPAYWCALALGLAWVIVLYRDPLVAALRAVPALFAVQAWFPDPAVHFAADGVEWSVSDECFFYLLFPVLVRLAFDRVGRAVLLAIAVALAGVLPVLLQPLASDPLVQWATQVFPCVRLGEFLCGLLLAVVMRSRVVRVPPAPLAAVAVVACIGLLPHAPAWVPQRVVWVAVIMWVISALANGDVSGRRSILARAVPRRLGEWSYCFYLVHQIVLQVMLFASARLVRGLLQGPVWLASALCASVLVAAALHFGVERPAERRLRPARTAAPRMGSGDLREVDAPVLQT